MIKDDNYIVIQGFMLNKLKLKGNELLIYACIYGFTQVEGQWFSGSIDYLTEWTGASRQTVISTLQNLCDKKLIEKKEEIKNGSIKKCFYKINSEALNTSQEILPDESKNFTRTSQEILPVTSQIFLPNNIDINNIDNNIEIIREKEEQEEDNKTGSDFEIRMLIGTRKIKVWDIKKLNKPIERIRAVFKFAQENNKHEGWIIGALKNDWDLKLYNSNSYKKQEQALYKPASAREVLE